MGATAPFSEGQLWYYNKHMKTHESKIAGAVVSAALMITLFMVYPFALNLIGDLPFAVRFGFSGFYIALAAGVLYQLIMRIREIKGGEEDDLDNY